MHVKFFLIFLASISGLIFMGMIFFIIGYRRTSKNKDWEKTTGEIIKKQMNIQLNIGSLFGMKSRPKPDTKPSVEYVVDGETFVHTSDIKQNPGIPPGKIVDVLYDPHDPNNAVIDTFVQSGKLFQVIGKILLIISCCLIVFGFALSFFI